MKKKKKGFTLLELIITLSITVVVLGTIYTFFLNTNKTIITSEVNSDLQMEIEKIQKELSKYGSEARGLASINGMEVKVLDPTIPSNPDEIKYSSIITESTGKLDVTEISFKVDNDKYKFTFNSSTRVLALKKNLESDVQLSNKVTEFKVRPLDYRSNPGGNFNNVNGLEISFMLNVKKGYSDVTTPASLIVKFRNK
ncbi:prepilin-type N-terminal cleavage/methylation domain-containing protein [Clostridium tertium]|uniref:Prepilin-type N-terminal cleavage/methylation domain-containing protein n=1 Tax=Clostridium tertium TaxID=1559 RepID=A0A6N3GXT6_9CLOT